MNWVEPTEWMEPDKVEFHLADNVFVKMIALPAGGMVARGHKHSFDHTSFLATGSMRVWVDDTLLGDVKAPTGIFIAAGKVHRMQALEDNTLFLCVHNTHGVGDEELRDHLLLKE